MGTVQKFSALGLGIAIGTIFVAVWGKLARWAVIDGWSLQEVHDFYTRQAAQGHASDLNEELMHLGVVHPRYHVIHKSVTKEWS